MTVHPALLLAENSLFKAVGEIFHPLFVAIAAVLAWIYGIVPTYTVAIVLLTVVIMALLTPLTIKSTRSMLAMQALQPEMQKLRAKYKGAENRQQLNEELMKLYREHGVSPTGGCLPMFLQMPAFIVLYDVIKGLANTVKRGATLTTGKACTRTVCATPRYVPHHSAIYDNLIKTPGVMRSIGLNLAAKPLTHHASWPDYIPYFALLAVAVALQYLQMAQMTRRNKRNNTAQAMPQQMQTMQRVMPLIFAYIYFLVPAGVVIYMIVSSGIRVITQDLMFRSGVVQAPGGERRVGAAKAKPSDGSPAIDARSSTAASRQQGQRQAPAAASAAVPADGAERALTTGGQRAETNGAQPGPADGTGTASARRSRGKSGNTSGTTSAAPPSPPPTPKAHPRSKSKRVRKAR
ncbi:MAG: YidC/Oxa1 family membrane protein insertase [Actinomycetota bacterium]|nr:YidC/Oxa1 family membrane protein insertase [Actinomycetota bacterium]